MVKTVIILALIVLVSCIRSEKAVEKKTEDLKDTLENIFFESEKAIELKKENNQIDTLILSANIDRVEILCLFFGKYSNKSFRLFLSNTNLNIINAADEKDTIYVDYKRNKRKLIRNINRFYINKEEEIVLKKIKRDYIKSTDYPYIKVIGYRGMKEIFNTETQIGEEDYNVEYNPQFLKFYEFLNNLIKACLIHKP